MNRENTLATYVINLARRPDRRAWIRRHLPSRLEVIYTSDWEYLIDGQQLSLPQLNAAGVGLFDWQIDSANPWWSRPLRYGEIGCTLAHLACWTHATAQSIKPYILILEDDANLVPDFIEILLTGIEQLAHHRIPFDLLYLGRDPLEPDRPTSVSGLVYPGYSHCTYAYLLTRRGLRIVLAAGLRSAIIPVDEFLPAMYLPHPRPDVRTKFPSQLRAIAFDPPLATQRPKHIAGSDTEDTAFISQY